MLTPSGRRQPTSSTTATTTTTKRATWKFDLWRWEMELSLAAFCLHQQQSPNITSTLHMTRQKDRKDWSSRFTLYSLFFNLPSHTDIMAAALPTLSSADVTDVTCIFIFLDTEPYMCSISACRRIKSSSQLELSFSCMKSDMEILIRDVFFFFFKCFFPAL